MSLETLLEAAEYLELSGPNKSNKTREDGGRDFHAYAKASLDYGSDDSNDNGKFYFGNDEDGKEKRRSGGAGTREVHNKLEKNRRAHLKECFDTLKYQVPSIKDKKTSNLTILRGALRYIQALRRKEKDFEQEMQKWALEKIALTHRIHTLRGDLNKMNIDFDLEVWVSNQDQETASTSTASENGTALETEQDQGNLPENKTDPQVVVPSSTVATVAITVPPPTSLSVAVGPRPKLLNAAIMTPLVAPTHRTPVTQILNQTIRQRAHLQLLRQQLEVQKQKQLLQQKKQENPEKAVTSQANNVYPNTQLVKSLSQTQPQSTLSSSIDLQAKPYTFNAQINAMSKLASAISIPTTPTPKNIGHTIKIPISNVATTTAIALGASISSTAVSQPVVKATTSVVSMSVTPTVSSQPMRVGIMGTTPMNHAYTASFVTPVNGPLNSTTVVPTNIKQLLNAPGPHLVSAGTQLTLNPLRSTLGQMLSSVTNVRGVTLSSGANQMSTVHPVVSLAHITPGPTHIMSPVSLVSPNVHVSNLSQHQINSMMQQPLIKSINHLPIIQPQFLQAGHVVGQQMVKPLVLLPNVTTAQQGQVGVAVTRTTS